jgi:hypothetical protein
MAIITATGGSQVSDGVYDATLVVVELQEPGESSPNQRR